MNFFQNLLQPNPVESLYNILVFLILFVSIIIFIAFYYDKKRNDYNLKKIETSEKALKDLIEAFRSLEMSFSEQNRVLDDFKYILERHNQEISRLADSLKEESNITLAIKMANEGKSIDEIAKVTGMSIEEAEPIIKYHGK